MRLRSSESLLVRLNLPGVALSAILFLSPLAAESNYSTVKIVHDNKVHH
jgi:hypothetical protein